MTSFWVYYMLILCSHVHSYQPPGYASHVYAAGKPKLAADFIQLITPLPLSAPALSNATSAYRSLTIPFPQLPTFFQPRVTTLPTLVSSASAPVTVFAEVTTKKPVAKAKKMKVVTGEDEMQNYITEIDSEKQHERKLADILPLVTFDCHHRVEGYYADVAFQCEVFHYCGKPTGKKFTFFCPTGSRFNQIHLICDYEMFQGCDKSHEYYHLNDKIYPKDDNSTSPKTQYHLTNSTSTPVHFTYKPVTTTPRQIPIQKPKFQQVEDILIKRPERSKQSHRRWAMAVPQGPILMRVPPRMSRLQSSASHLPHSRVLLKPHLVPRVRGKSSSPMQKIAIPVPMSRLDMPRRLPVLKPHIVSNRRHSPLQYFPPANQFRRRPLPPPELAYEYDEPFEPMSGSRMAMGHHEEFRPKRKKGDWRLMEDDWSRGIEAEEEKPVEASRRISQASTNRRTVIKDKWDELDKAVAQWKMAGQRKLQNDVKGTSESEESDSESSEEDDTTTVATKRKKFVARKKPTAATTKTSTTETSTIKTTTPRATTTMPTLSPVSTTATTTTTRRPMLKTRVKTSSIGGRLNTRRKKTTTTTSTTTTMAPFIITPTTTATPPLEEIFAFTQQIPETTTMSRIKPKHKHRFSKVQRTRLKTSTFPPISSPTSTFAITIKPATTEFPTFQPLTNYKPIASASVNAEDSVGNEKSYI